MVVKEVRVKRLGVISSSIFLGTWSAVFFVIVGFISSIIMMSNFLIDGTIWQGFLFAFVVTLIIPPLLGVVVFVLTLIPVLLINLALKLVNGFKMDLDV